MPLVVVRSSASRAYILPNTAPVSSSSILVPSEGVKREFLHQVGVNYFYAPWTSALLLLHAWPWPLKGCSAAVPSVWALVLVAPVVALDVKIYGQWLIKGKRFLSRVANPASQLSVIANLVAAAQMAVSGWTEFALCWDYLCASE